MSGRAAAILLTCMAMTAHAADDLVLEATIPMPGVKGRIDHLALDGARHRVFVSALGNGSVEVVDPRRRTASVAGFAEPQGIAYIAASDRVFVANGDGDRVDVLDGPTLKVVKRIDGLADADNVRYDVSAATVLVGYGRGALAILDAASGDVMGRIALPGHPESFQLERGGHRVFVNVPSAGKVVVVDRVRRTVSASWDLHDAARNFPMALDEGARRLFIGARSPAVLLVLDADSGQEVARVAIGGDTDDVFYDAARKRIYAICGEGRIDVVRQESSDRYARAASIDTAPGARTGLFVPEASRLYVAAPASGDTPARLLVFRMR